MAGNLAYEIPTPERTAAACAKARADGLRVWWGNDHTLLLDWDVPHGGASFHEKVANVFRVHERGLLPLEAFLHCRSKSGNAHVWLGLQKPLPLVDRIFWQAALGSDPVREALHMRYYKAGHPGEPCVLFAVVGARIELEELA